MTTPWRFHYSLILLSGGLVALSMSGCLDDSDGGNHPPSTATNTVSGADTSDDSEKDVDVSGAWRLETFQQIGETDVGLCGNCSWEMDIRQSGSRVEGSIADAECNSSVSGEVDGGEVMFSILPTGSSASGGCVDLPVSLAGAVEDGVMVGDDGTWQASRL